MPSFKIPGQDNSKNWAQVSTGAGSAASGPAGAGPAQPGQAGPSGMMPMASPQGGSGTGFINLQNVLAANKSGAAGLQNALAGKANQLGQDAQSAYDYDKANASKNYSDSQSKTDAQNMSNNLGYTRDMQSYKDAYDRTQGEAGIALAMSNPKAFASYQNILKAGPPKAPTALTNDAPNTISGYLGAGAYQGLQDKLAGAASYANGLNSFSGRQADLGQIYGKTGQYSSGMSALDSLLAGSGGKNGPMGDAASKYGGLNSLVGANGIDINTNKGGTNGDGTSSAPMPGVGKPPVGPGSTQGGGPVLMGYPQPAGVPAQPPAPVVAPTVNKPTYSQPPKTKGKFYA